MKVNKKNNLKKKNFNLMDSGLVPRVLFEASTIAITNVLAYLIKNYVFEDKEVDTFIDLFSSVQTF